MPWFRCYHCQDLRPGLVGMYKEFEADRPLCPHCNATGQGVVRLVPVHFLLPDAKGPILSDGATRWKIGCMPKREHLAVSTADEFSATGDPRAVTCLSCKGLPAWREQAMLFPEITHQLVLDDGCCG